jgi:hypothetical protein
MKKNKTKSLWAASLFQDIIKSSYFMSNITYAPPTLRQKIWYSIRGIYYRLSDTFLVLVGEKIAINEEDAYYD